MTQIEIDKEEILKGSKWIRFLFMILYGFVINFVISLSISWRSIKLLSKKGSFIIFIIKIL